MLNYSANGPSGYNLTNSLRFRASASAYLSRTPASAGNRKTWTWSAWVKRGALPNDTSQYSMLSSGGSGGDVIMFSDGNKFSVNIGLLGLNAGVIPTQVQRDPSAWYHLVVAIDTAQATASNRVKMYVNGVQITSFSITNYPSQNTDTTINSTTVQDIGRQTTYGNYFDGYMAEVNFIDGQALTPSSFGSTNATTGVWQPARYTGTYGTNGFYLNFTDIALTSGSNTGLGRDFSGNGNYWNTNNISVTSGVTYDAMTDVPTLTSATVANYAVLNPLWKASTGTLSSANLNYTDSDSLQKYVRGTIGVTSGKWYFECAFTNTTSPMFVGMSADTETSTSGNAYIGNSANGWSMQVTTTVNKVNNGTFTSISSTNYINTSNIFQVAYDADNGKLFFGVNNTWFGSADPVAGTNAQFTGVSGTLYASIGTQGNGAVAINFGQRPFSYTPPTGFNRLNTFNLPDSTIVKGNTVMDATLYTGNSTSNRAITNASGFKPDLIWIKNRGQAIDNILEDSVRTAGSNKILISNSTAAEGDAAGNGYINSINSNGFSVTAGTSGVNQYLNVNENSIAYVAWQWQAGQGTNTTNTAGSITSTVSVNATAGFSIVTFTGNGVASTVGHGLGVAPAMIITKGLSLATSWIVYHKSLTNAQNVGLILNTTATPATSTTYWNNTAPTSTVYSVGTQGNTNANLGGQVAYCWAEIAGFSKFGSYTGNFNADGPFIYTGFRPKFVLLKSSGDTGSWNLLDATRNPSNVANARLFPNNSNAEATTTFVDFLSNGFKIRTSDSDINYTVTNIYAAFAENPFKNSLAR